MFRQGDNSDIKPVLPYGPVKSTDIRKKYYNVMEYKVERKQLGK